MAGPDRRQGPRVAAGRAMLAAAVALAAAACADGYPTEDVPQVLPSEMTEAQLIGALNHLGRGAHLEREWRFGLEPGCRLSITQDNGTATRTTVSLAGAVVESPFDEEGRHYDIRLLPASGDAEAPASVLVTGKWTDSVQAKSLLSHLQHRCGMTGNDSPP
ncbi:hypothetical protein V4F39_10695 [Aquincola sp. MAHUQ-54]|uniref:Lipoprotein n=1 Tax=Aquincola agrisoli TaxID=3119538 RepID=A0AAW9QC60_9BURK